MTRKRTKRANTKAAGEAEGGGRHPDAEPAAPVSDGPVPGWWPAFLLDLTMTNCVELSARNCGMTHQAVYALVKRRPELKEQMDVASVVRAGMLRKFAFQAATEGVKLPIKDPEGRVVGYTFKWDARVLLTMLGAELPEYKGKGGEGGVQVTNNVTVATAGVSETLRAFADAAREYLAGQTHGQAAPGGRDVPPAVVDWPDVPDSRGGRPVGAH